MTARERAAVEDDADRLLRFIAACATTRDVIVVQKEVSLTPSKAYRPTAGISGLSAAILVDLRELEVPP